VYVKFKVDVPEPEVYDAVLSVEPVSRVNVGVPPAVLTVTTSEKLTSITIASPALYLPSDAVEVTFRTVGAVVSLLATVTLVEALEPEA
jgi:hypothetical protein